MKDHPTVIPIAVADDVTFSAPPELVLEVSSVFNRLLSTAGLVSRPDKKFFVSLHPDAIRRTSPNSLKNRKLL